MQEIGSVPHNTPDLEKFIKETVRLAVKAYIKNVAAVFGITNIAVLIGIIAYVAETAPQKVIEIVTKNEKSVEELQRGLGEVRDNVTAFRSNMTKNEEDISNLSTSIAHEFDKLKGSIPGLNEQLNQINDQIRHIKQTMQTLSSTSQVDIDKAAKILTIIKTMPAESEIISRISSIEQNTKRIQDQVNGFTSGKTVFDILSARRISIKGQQGRELGYLGIGTETKDSDTLKDSDTVEWLQSLFETVEYGELRLYDSNSKNRVALKSELHGGSLQLLDGKEKESVGLYKSGLSLYDSNGTSRMSLTTRTDGRASLALRDAKGNDRVQLYEDESGDPDFALFDSGKNLLTYLTTKSLYVNGKERFLQPPTRAGTPP